jgi:sec-independent protein translocase protein TatC
MTKPDPNQMSFFEHLEEIRIRLGKSLIIWVVIFSVCFGFNKEILDFLAAPLYAITEPPYFGAVDLKEPFLASLKACFWVSIILSSGIFFYQLWAFVAPGLTPSEKRFAIPFIIFMAIFFMAGCLFSFTQIFPIALDFLVGWNDQNLNAFTRSSYLSLLFALVLGMGASFEMPLVIYFLARIGIVTPQFLLRQFKYAVLIIFTVAAIITPTPDPWTQTFLAGPMLLLYLLGIALAYTVPKPKPVEDGEIAVAGDESL